MGKVELSGRDDDLSDVKSRLNGSIKNGRLTEDLLSEVKSIWGAKSLSPVQKSSIQNKNNHVAKNSNGEFVITGCASSQDL